MISIKEKLCLMVQTENNICSTFSATLDVLLNKNMKCWQVTDIIIHLAISFFFRLHSICTKCEALSCNIYNDLS